MLITRTKAKRILRARTGRSIEWCGAVILGLPKTIDGKRWKVSSSAVDRAVAEANREIEWEPPTPAGIKPLSDRKRRRISENCI